MRNRTLLSITFLSATLLACGGETPAAEAPVAPPLAAPTPVATAPVEAPALAVPAPMEASSKPAAPPSSHNDFTMTMFRALHGEKGNVFFSAESLREALGMTALGAKGKTLEEMSQALGTDPEAQKNASNAKKDGDVWKRAAGKAELVIANRLWVANNYPLDKTFLAETLDGYGASATPEDFRGAAEPSRQQINSWVTQTTKGKIKDLLPGGAIDSSTRLVLTNAIYFKGNWTTPFEKNATHDNAFRTETGSVNVPTMHRNGSMSYAEVDGVQLVELPYKDSDLTLLVALPKADAFATTEKQLTGAQVDTWAKGLSNARVDLSFPKFTFSWGRSVKSELQGMGLSTAFSGQADFTAMSPLASTDGLHISDVFHKGFVLVDETGTEAAAATGVTVARASVSVAERPVVMKVDHPFLFFVRNGKTGDVLFAGRVANPKG